MTELKTNEWRTFIEHIPPSYPARPYRGGVPLGTAWRKMNHKEIVYTPKYNGWRVLLHVRTGVCYNRKLQILTIGEEFRESIYKIQKCCPDDIEWIDCEGLERRHGIGKGTLIVLDFMPTPVVQHEALDISYEDRQSVLAVALHKVNDHDVLSKPEEDSVYFAPHYNSDEVRVLDSMLKSRNKEWDAEFYEGWVGVKATSKYPIQLVGADKKTFTWTKHRWDS
jgi:hypothetical protein